MFERDKNGLAFQPAKLRIHLAGSGKVLDKAILWDRDVHDWLVKHRCRTELEYNEGERFGYLLRERFAYLISLYGDGLFNAVLLSELQGIDEVVWHPRLGPLFQAFSASEIRATSCRSHIAGVLSTCGAKIKWLKYPPKVCQTILLEAIVYFLDERFNITNASLIKQSQWAR